MKNQPWIAVGFLLLFGGLLGCTPSPPKYPTSIDYMDASLREAYQGNKELKCKSVPRAIQNALLPTMPHGILSQSNTEGRFDVSAKDIPAKTFFLSLFKGTSTNIIIDPKISGTLSLELQQVTLEETLAATRDIYGYDYKATPYGYEIFPATLQTRIFNVNYLNVKRTADSQTQLNSSEITDVLAGQPTGTGGTSGTSSTQTNSPSSIPGNPLPGSNSVTGTPVGSTVVTHSEADFWKHLEAGIKTIIGKEQGRSVVVNPQAGIIMARAYPSELREVGQFLDISEHNLHRQVIIEAKVLEVELNDQSQSGIDWNAFSQGLTQTGTDVKVLPQDFTSMFNIQMSAFHGTFTGLIKLLQQQGNVQVLSSPRISTVNNQNAMIKVGNDQFFVTSVTTNITPGSSTNTTSQSVGLTPFFSGITLNVTPQISSNGEIVLYIHPSVSEVTDQTKTIDLGESGVLVLPLAKSTIRETDSIVRAKNGEFIVLGGLMSHTTNELIAETPLLSRIPFVGALFRDTDQRSTKSELVILLRPQVTGYKTWQRELCCAQKRIKRVDRGMHLGAVPEIFGTEGERFEE